MSVIRVGSSNTYAEGWDAIFGGGTRRTPSASKKKAAGPSTARKSKKPAAGKPAAAKARRGK